MLKLCASSCKLMYWGWGRTFRELINSGPFTGLELYGRRWPAGRLIRLIYTVLDPPRSQFIDGGVRTMSSDAAVVERPSHLDNLKPTLVCSSLIKTPKAKSYVFRL